MKIVGLIFPETEEQTSAETKEQTFCCSVCGKKYKSGTALQKHMKEKHSDESEE